MTIFGYSITASNWPWNDGFNWKGRTGLRSGLGRFGGGWNFCLGIEIGSNSAIINLGLGLIRISRVRK
jgi:hypothetical protein